MKESFKNAARKMLHAAVYQEVISIPMDWLPKALKKTPVVGRLLSVKGVKDEMIYNAGYLGVILFGAALGPFTGNSVFLGSGLAAIMGGGAMMICNVGREKENKHPLHGPTVEEVIIKKTAHWIFPITGLVGFAAVNMAVNAVDNAWGVGAVEQALEQKITEQAKEKAAEIAEAKEGGTYYVNITKDEKTYTFAVDGENMVSMLKNGALRELPDTTQTAVQKIEPVRSTVGKAVVAKRTPVLSQ